MKATKLPSGSYRCQVTVGGKRMSVTRRTAAEAKRDAMGLIVNGKSDEADIYHGATLKSACEEFIDLRRATLSPSTIRGYHQISTNRIQTIIDFPLSVLSDAQIQAAVNQDLRTVSPKTMKNAMAFFRTVIKYKTGRDIRVSLPQIIKEERAFLPPEMIPEFLATIKGLKHELAYLLGLHGLRVSEILALKKESIADGVIHIRGAAVLDEYGSLVHKETNKNQSSRRDVPVFIPRLQELVDAAPDGILVSASARRLSAGLEILCRRHNLPRLTMHSLRHSFCSVCYRLKISEAETMALGGWSDPSVMRRVYTHLSELDRKNAADKLKEFFK